MDWGIFWTAAGAIAAIIGVLLKVKDKSKNAQKDSSFSKPSTDHIAEYYTANNKKIHRFTIYKRIRNTLSASKIYFVSEKLLPVLSPLHKCSNW